MLTPEICKLARTGLGWSTKQLAARAGVGLNTVNRFEGEYGARQTSQDKIQRAFELGGVEFLDPCHEHNGGFKIRKVHGVKVTFDK